MASPFVATIDPREDRQSGTKRTRKNHVLKISKLQGLELPEFPALFLVYTSFHRVECLQDENMADGLAHFYAANMF
jgi:hypothetical protein